ncbi:hypothetical protein QR680_017717 [Steinernema hermaphroditum]|uniref:Uncharacterized protein n=1 Tax=Steinernema hermaphroditum TaxID=289476 RepID=A0AA39HFK5_9BILA|nr:hypothetical protein QR680_017717 [Steinernema hermaphroditum]
MRLYLSTLIPLLSICCCVFGANTTTMEELLKTNQFLVVAVSGCKITFETDWPSRSCGHYVVDNSSVSDSVCEWTSIVPLTDSSEDSKAPMKLLFIGKVNKKPVEFVRNLEFPKGSGEGWHFKSVNVLENKTDISLSANYYFRLASNVMYQAEKKMVYITARLGTYHNLITYAIDGFFTGQKLANPKHIPTSSASTYLSTLKWFSDPYSRKFYYYDNSTENGPCIKSVDMDGYMHLMQHESTGVNEFKFAEKPSYVSVSGGAIFATYDANSPSRHSIIPLHNSSVGIRCNASKVQPTDAVIVVRDWEYCKLRDGEQANFNLCTRENPWRKQLPIQAEPQSVTQGSSFFSLIVLIVIAATIVLVVLICVIAYTRRSRYELVNNVRNVQAAYPHLASDMSYDF